MAAEGAHFHCFVVNGLQDLDGRVTGRLETMCPRTNLLRPLWSPRWIIPETKGPKMKQQFAPT